MDMQINDEQYAIEYVTFNEDDKLAVLDKIIDASLILIEKALAFNPEINRINFLIQSFKESLQEQEKLENYECCALIMDLIKRIEEA